MSHFDLDAWITAAKIATLTPTNDRVPSLVEKLTGDRVRGSWWSHPRAHLIYNTYQQIVAADFILTVKLIDRKVTFVHQDLWAPMLSAVNHRRLIDVSVGRYSLIPQTLQTAYLNCISRVL